LSYSAIIRSSDVRALADDARKDDENVGFLAKLPLSEQGEWLTRLRWLRLADRLAENELVEPGSRRFAEFCEEWRAFSESGEVRGEHAATWGEMRFAWWSTSAGVRARRPIASFGQYLDALHDYTRPGLEIPTLREHDRMLLRVTGNGICVFPFLRDEQCDAAAGFGMLDQMMNNLRDVAEDASQGLCFFPRDVLARFGVRVGAMLDGSAVGTRAYESMMRFWLDEHIALVRELAAPFAALRELHPSLVAMRGACLARYARIERVFRGCDYDFVGFPGAYWGESVSEPRVA
jgi:phytoene synthase